MALSGTAAGQESCRYEEGVTAFDGGNIADAIDAWLPCAEDGDAEAQYRLALAYISTGDSANVIRWLEFAIAEGRLWTPPPPWLGDAIEILRSLR